MASRTVRLSSSRCWCSASPSSSSSVAGAQPAPGAGAAARHGPRPDRRRAARRRRRRGRPGRGARRGAPGRCATSGIGRRRRSRTSRPAGTRSGLEFPGFQTALVRDVRVRAGDNRRTITLALKKLDEDVTVTRDKQSAAMDPRGVGVQHGAHARADRVAARRPRRDGGRAQGDGAPGRDDPRRRVHRRPAAAQVADPFDPSAAARHVRRPEPRRHERGALHRHHDDARRRADARQRGLQRSSTTRSSARNPMTTDQGARSSCGRGTSRCRARSRRTRRRSRCRPAAPRRISRPTSSPSSPTAAGSPSLCASRWTDGT